MDKKYDEPNLVNDDNIKNDNLRTTDTNMFPNYLANTEKLVSTERRWNPEDNNHHEDNREVDDDIKRYVENEKNRYSDNRKTDTKSHVQPKVDTESFSHVPPQEEEMSKEELRIRKLDMIRKLGELKRYGVKLSQNYNMNSDYDTMKYEYELHTSIRSKQNAVSWMSNIMVGIVGGLETLNDNYNPFDIKLTGWRSNVSDNIMSYYDVLGEIYEKYNSPGKSMAPELKLFLLLTGSAVGLSMNKALIKELPGETQTLENNPEFVEQLRKKASDDKKSNAENLQEMMEKEHSMASQKAADLQLIKDKELEFQKMKRMLDEEQNKMNALKEGMMLSPESVGSNLHNLQQELAKRQEEQQRVMKQQEVQRLATILNNVTSEKSKSSDKRKKSDTESLSMSESSNMSSIIVNKQLQNQLEKERQNNVTSRVVNKYDIRKEDISFGSRDSDKKRKGLKITMGKK